MSRRFITISNFRNLGIGKPTTLLLNDTYEKGKSGDLIILIGQNNAGKSNVLSALKIIKSRQFTSSDVPIMNLGNDELPEIDYVIQADNNNAYCQKLKYSSMYSARIIEDSVDTLYDEDIANLDDLESSVFNYENKNIVTSDFNTTPEYLNNNKFICSVLNAIDINPDTVKDTYDQYRKTPNIFFLQVLQNKINQRLKKLTEIFNNLYKSTADPYNFMIVLSNSQISFGLGRGNGDSLTPLVLEQQSTGFRWFFNFFFTLFNRGSSKSIHPGDIVIMDEPATNLHPQGQRELRDFIKAFAVANDITFVIATHSPFLVNSDELNELRVVRMKDNKAEIINLFSAVDVDDPDSLLPIKDALTIKQNILYDYDTRVVWVEGITDYNYLTMFKKLLGYQNISFLPFKGVGKEDMQDVIIQKLASIKFPNVEILVDADKAGLAFKQKCQNTKFKDRVISIDQVSSNAKYKEIENLFSVTDRQKYKALNENDPDGFKKASTTSAMKKFCKLEDFSKETIDNFKALFELLIN